MSSQPHLILSFLFIGIFMTSVSAQNHPGFKRENFQIRLGMGEGEIGALKPPIGHDFYNLNEIDFMEGPLAFELSQKGDFYFLDLVKENVSIYSSKGDFIKVLPLPRPKPGQTNGIVDFRISGAKIYFQDNLRDGFFPIYQVNGKLTAGPPVPFPPKGEGYPLGFRLLDSGVLRFLNSKKGNLEEIQIPSKPGKKPDYRSWPLPKGLETLLDGFAGNDTLAFQADPQNQGVARFYFLSPGVEKPVFAFNSPQVENLIRVEVLGTGEETLFLGMITGGDLQARLTEVFEISRSGTLLRREKLVERIPTWKPRRFYAQNKKILALMTHDSGSDFLKLTLFHK